MLQTKKAAGIDAARRNCGLGRWVNDPRGAVDEHGRARQANCEFVLHTPPGSGQRIAAVRTLHPIERGEELLARYGNGYWRFHAPAAAKQKRRPRRQPRRAPQHQSGGVIAVPVVPLRATQMEIADRRKARDQHFEAILTLTLASIDTGARRQLRPTASRRSAHAEASWRARPEQDSARAGRSAETAPAAEAAAAANEGALPIDDGAAPERRAQDEHPAAPEALMSAVRRVAAADDDYQRRLQSPGPDIHANDGLLFDTQGRMLVPADRALRTRILAELHDSATGAHCGRDRMLAAAQRRFEWRGLARDAEQYVLTCDACQRNKHSKQLKPGLLMPLPLPEEPCLHWTTDAVCGLPRSRRGFDAIQVYVDRLTKLKRFAVARTSDGSVQLAGTTLRAIIGPHGMPKSMVSDRDPRITARFWRELSRLLGSEVACRRRITRSRTASRSARSRPW